MVEDPTTGRAPDACTVSGYQQIYIIKHASPDNQRNQSGIREVFFCCGNWCYSGNVCFNDLSQNRRNQSNNRVDENIIGLQDIPAIIPILQSQQDNLCLVSEASSIPSSSCFVGAIDAIQQAQEFLSKELASQGFADKLEGRISQYPWVDDDSEAYFELVGSAGVPLDDIQCICSKNYTRGLVFAMIYFEGTFYATIQDGLGEQPLLDVQFPDISRQGQGTTLSTYAGNYGGYQHKWQRIVLWRSLDSEKDIDSATKPYVPHTVDLSSDLYIQTYCILKPQTTNKSAAIREVLFCFGSWCYSGQVELTPELTLEDVPYVIPALRVQQGKLNYLCDVSRLPSNSCFASALKYASEVTAAMEQEVSACDDTLVQLMSQIVLSGLKESDVEWLKGDPGRSFFEFSYAPDSISCAVHEAIDLVAVKRYNPNGLVTIAIYFDGVYYLSINDGVGEQPLLDSAFPNVASKGIGFQLRSYSNGVLRWPQLRKLSIWQNLAFNEEESQEKEPNGTNEKARLKTPLVSKKSMEDESIDLNATTYGIQNECKQHQLTLPKDNCVPPTDAQLSEKNNKTADDSIHVAASKSYCDFGEGNELKQLTETSPQRKDLSSIPKKKRIVIGKGNRQNLGAFHHLAPLKKPSKLRRQLDDLRVSNNKNVGEGSQAPWDKSGRPTEMKDVRDCSRIAGI